MDKVKRNRDNIKQVIAVLIEANYRSGKSTLLGERGEETVEWWVGGGSVPVIILHTYEDDNGFEVYVPLNQSNDMKDVLAALAVAITPKEG